MSKAKPEPRMSGPRRPGGARLLDGVGDPGLGLGVLAADVEVALRAAGREGGDRHRLDGRERVALEQDAVLERARLGLVGVADQVVGLAGWAADGRPLAAGREGRAAASHQLRRGHLGDHGLRAHLEGAGQGRVAAHARGSRSSEVGSTTPTRARRRVGVPGAVAATISLGRSRTVGARRPGAGSSDSSRAMIPAASTGARAKERLSPPATVSIAAGARSHRPRHGLRSQVARAVADRLAGRAERSFQVAAQRLGAGQPAGDVVADVGDDRRSRRRREQRVERGDAIGLGRRDGQALADVVEGRLADPADPTLDRVEGRQELRAPAAGRMAAACRMTVDRRIAAAARPAGGRRAQDGVNGGSFGGRGERPDDVEVHRGRV